MMTPDKPLPYDPPNLGMVHLPFIRHVPDVVLVEGPKPDVTRDAFVQKVHTAGRLIAEAYDRAYNPSLCTMGPNLNVRIEVAGYDDKTAKLEPNAPEWHKPKASLRGDTRTKKPWEH